MFIGSQVKPTASFLPLDRFVCTPYTQRNISPAESECQLILHKKKKEKIVNATINFM